MKTAIAKTSLYINSNGLKKITISVYMPERDISPGGNYRCGVRISGGKLRYIYGFDTFQALSLAMWFVRTEVDNIERNNVALYFDRNCMDRINASSIWGPRMLEMK